MTEEKKETGMMPPGEANNETMKPSQPTSDLKSDNQKSMELLYNWYQSYYLWSMTNSLNNFSMMYPANRKAACSIHSFVFLYKDIF